MIQQPVISRGNFAALHAAQMMQRRRFQQVIVPGGLSFGPRGLAFGPQGVAFTAADVAAATDSLNVALSDDVAELSTRAARHGIGRLSPRELLVLVLAWLLVGAPILQEYLPPEAQSVLSNEYKVLGIPVAVTIAVIVNSRKR